MTAAFRRERASKDMVVVGIYVQYSIAHIIIYYIVHISILDVVFYKI